MKTFLRYFATLLWAMSLVACSSFSDDISYDLETYVWLEREGIWDPEFPTSKVHKLLKKGIRHDDSEIVRCSISAILLYAARIRFFRDGGFPQPQPNRRLNEVPGVLESLTEVWQLGWKEADGVVPSVELPADIEDRVLNKTGCVVLEPIWTALVYAMIEIFPGDEAVHAIVWKQIPQSRPEILLELLWDGKFNFPKDERYRIEVLKNPDSSLSQARLAATSLGTFRSKNGLEALATTLEQEEMQSYVSPTMTIIDSMFKYETDAVPYIDLMRRVLESVETIGSQEHKQRESMLKRLAQFEQDHAGDQDEPIK